MLLRFLVCSSSHQSSFFRSSSPCSWPPRVLVFCVSLLFQVTVSSCQSVCVSSVSLKVCGNVSTSSLLCLVSHLLALPTLFLFVLSGFSLVPRRCCFSCCAPSYSSLVFVQLSTDQPRVPHPAVMNNMTLYLYVFMFMGFDHFFRYVCID